MTLSYKDIAHPSKHKKVKFKRDRIIETLETVLTLPLLIGLLNLLQIHGKTFTLYNWYRLERIVRW